MQGGNENENNDDVNDANVYVKKCDPVSIRLSLI